MTGRIRLCSRAEVPEPGEARRFPVEVFPVITDNDDIYIEVQTT